MDVLKIYLSVDLHTIHQSTICIRLPPPPSVHLSRGRRRETKPLTAQAACKQQSGKPFKDAASNGRITEIEALFKFQSVISEKSPSGSGVLFPSMMRFF